MSRFILIISAENILQAESKTSDRCRRQLPECRRRRSWRQGNPPRRTARVGIRQRIVIHELVRLYAHGNAKECDWG